MENIEHNNKPRTFVMGDIHGSYRALLQCLERSGFDKEKDTLIQLGDVADGWQEVYECVEELLTIKNLISIKGNHDEWVSEWIKTNSHACSWLQGGEATLKSYCKHLDKEYVGRMGGYTTSLLDTDLPMNHRDFFLKQHLYYRDEENRLFIHGGFNRYQKLNSTPHHDYYWNRSLWHQALSCGDGVKLKTEDNFLEIFIGHTTTMMWSTDKPMNSGGVWNLDTGAGYKGKLTIMNVETKEYFQSDNVQDLYPNQKGR